jgi:autotransporter adhesin
MQQKKIVLALSLALGAGLAQAQSTEYGTGATASGNSATAIGINGLAGTTYSGGGPILLIAPSSPYVNQVAVGTAALSWGYGDVAIGTGTVAVSQPPLGSYSAATAIGYRSTVWGNNSIAVGNEAVAGPGAAGTAPGINITVSNATALGSQARAASTGSTAIGATANVTGTSATAIGTGSSAIGNNSVALGAGTVATQDSTVAVGSRRVVGLSDGTGATDAVTVQQLQAAIAGVGGIDTGAIINQAVGQANAYTDQAINGLRKEYSRAIAAVAASPALPALAPGERAIAVGTGYYNGQGGLGIAFAQALQSGAIINAGISGGSGGKPVVRAGAAWKF